MEVLIAMGMLVLLSLAVTSISIAAVRASVLAKHRLQAVFIAQEQLEIMRNIRDSNLANPTMGAFDDMWYGTGGGCIESSIGYCGKKATDPTNHLCCDTNEDAPTKSTTIYFRVGTPPDTNRYFTDLKLLGTGYTGKKRLSIEETKGDDTIRINYDTKIQITTLTETTFFFDSTRDGTEFDITLSYLRPGRSTSTENAASITDDEYLNIRRNAPRRVGVIVEWVEQTGGKQQLILEGVLTNLLVAPPPP